MVLFQMIIHSLIQITQRRQYGATDIGILKELLMDLMMMKYGFMSMALEVVMKLTLLKILKQTETLQEKGIMAGQRQHMELTTAVVK